MGAKTALLAFAEGDIATALSSTARADQAATEVLVRQVLPGYAVERAEDTTLSEPYPDDDITIATSLPGVDVFGDRRLMFDRPSELPDHLHEVAAGRRIVLHGMHSVVDWLSFAVWENGELIRSLSLAPDDGIIENIGEPFDFERPYWAGEHPVEPWPGMEDEEPYPLPFHPLDMGEDALRALFGFILEGMPMDTDIDADTVPLYGFHVADSTGQEQVDREAHLAALMANMGPRRVFQMGPDGVMREVEL